jgi:hypothetical protein
MGSSGVILRREHRSLCRPHGLGEDTSGRQNPALLPVLAWTQVAAIRSAGMAGRVTSCSDCIAGI